MNKERYSKDLPVTLQDFETSGWKEVIAQASPEGYAAMGQALSDAARRATEQDRAEHAKVLRLLADACATEMPPTAPHELERLLDTDIAFFAEIVDAIDESRLKGRISDILWLKTSPRNTEFALKAIDAYRCLPLTTDTWMHGGRECWHRAISLAQTLKAGDGR